MKVGFLTNHISYGGTDVSLYDYAHFNETLLGNTSVILTRDFRATHQEIYDKFNKRFPVFYITSQQDIDDVVVREKIDVLYVQKSGEVDHYVTTKCKCVVHAVFETRYPHGDVYAAISGSLNSLYKTKVPVVPYMVYLEEDTTETFRQELGIPDSAIVIGRHGSYGSFDIPFVKEAILKILNKHPNMYFVTMNTEPFAQHPRLLYLPRTTDLKVKRKFINTCNVMLHARTRGETFGLACAEFSLCKKPIVTYGASIERAHLDILGSKCTPYTNERELLTIFERGSWNIDVTTNGYMEYTPEKVMSIFNSVFLN
jgi:hypothetical protein